MTDRPFTLLIEPVDSVHSRAWKAVIETPIGRYSGGGLTPETAALDAFACWRVDVARAREKYHARRQPPLELL